MKADIVAETLRKILHDSSNNLMTPKSYMTKEDSDIQNQEQLQLRLYDVDNPPSVFDRWRVRLEDHLGLGPIDWYPLPPVNRLQNATQSKLTWRVSITPFPPLFSCHAKHHSLLKYRTVPMTERVPSSRVSNQRRRFSTMPAWNIHSQALSTCIVFRFGTDGL